MVKDHIFSPFLAPFPNYHHDHHNMIIFWLNHNMMMCSYTAAGLTSRQPPCRLTAKFKGKSWGRLGGWGGVDFQFKIWCYKLRQINPNLKSNFLQSFGAWNYKSIMISSYYPVTHKLFQRKNALQLFHFRFM